MNQCNHYSVVKSAIYTGEIACQECHNTFKLEKITSFGAYEPVLVRTGHTCFSAIDDGACSICRKDI